MFFNIIPTGKKQNKARIVQFGLMCNYQILCKKQDVESRIFVPYVKHGSKTKSVEALRYFAKILAQKHKTKCNQP